MGENYNMKVFKQMPEGGFKGHEVSLFQNFVCTTPVRLELIREFIPGWAKVLNPYPVIVNYDTEIYAEEVYSIYEKHIENLHFQQDLNQQWGEPVKEFFTMTDSPYILYLCEDNRFSTEITHEKFIEILNEFKSFGCKQMMLSRVRKYMTEHWHSKSKRSKNLWTFHSSESPYWQCSADGLFERNLYETVVKETIGRGKGLQGLDQFEQSGLQRRDGYPFSKDRDVMCCCPTNFILDHVQPSGTAER